MPPPDRIADLLIEREAYSVCGLLSTSDFLSFCRARNIEVSFERLRKLEQLGLFYPILRIYRNDTRHKVEYVDEGGRFRNLGIVGDEEVWAGETRTELAGFDFSARVIRSWRKHGFAWDPRVETSPHAASIDTDGRRHEAYYSQFQIDNLAAWITQFTVTVETEWAIEEGGGALGDVGGSGPI